jgi:hypothetical protein
MTEATIAQFVAGDHLSIERTITAVPSGQTIAQAWFTIKRKYSDTDNAALVQKVITPILQANIGHIDDTGADGTGHLIFSLTPADTAALTPLSDYRYDIQTKLSNGTINTPEVGTITAFPQVTISSS